MEWKRIGNADVGERSVEIRSLRVRDEDGRVRRLRVSTVWKPFAPDFTRTPAVGRLIKTPEGAVGVQISGRDMGHVKVGRTFLVQNTLLVPFNLLSRTAARSLLRGTRLSFEETDGMTVGFEPGDRSGRYAKDGVDEQKDDDRSGRGA